MQLAVIVLAVLVQRTLCARSFQIYTSPTPVFRVLWNGGEENLVVGARNHLFKLGKNFTLLQDVETGPLLDSIMCPPLPQYCDYPREYTDNDAKVMLFWGDNDAAVLICGTVGQGYCSVYNNNNLNGRFIRIGHLNSSSSFIAGKDTAVAFFGKNHEDEPTLYAATSYDQRPSYLSDYNIRSKVFVNGRTAHEFVFEYAYQSPQSVTGVKIASNLESNLQTKYLYGFRDNGYAYFLFTQWLSQDTFETRLGRVCEEDTKFFSYSEVSLRCLKESSQAYKLATTAYLGKVSKILQKARDMEFDEKVLYVAFGRADHGQEPKDKHGSILCMFPMSQIENAYLNATRDCFNAEPKARRIKSILGVDTKCEKKNLTQEELSDALCDPGVNHYIEGRESIPGGIRASVSEIITSLVVTLQHSNTVAFLGTKNGSLIKFVLEHNYDQGQIYNIPLDPESPQRAVQSSNAFDEQRQYLYLLTGNKVVKFPTGSCAPHPNCASCISSKDPLECGWCGDRCSTKVECKGDFKRLHCPPFISKVSPLTGHVEGGTLLTITGDNFGSQLSGPKGSIEVFVGEIRCAIIKWEYERVECRTAAGAESQSGPVRIHAVDTSYDRGLDINGTAFSSTSFLYLSPKLIGITPWFGAVSGGTNVSLVGEYLDVGSNQTVVLAGYDCSIFSHTGKQILCTSSPYQDENIETGSGRILGAARLWIDGHSVEPELDPLYPELKDSFEYRPDPEVSGVTPNSTIFSGGTQLNVTGRNLDSIFNPRLIVTVTHSLTGQQNTIMQDCQQGKPLGGKLVCPTPSLAGNSSTEGSPSPHVPIKTHISFLMDGVYKLRQFSSDHPQLSQLFYFPDPVLQPFVNNISKVRTDSFQLIIKGTNLDLALRPEDVMVHVNGTKRCLVTQLSFDTLRCSLGHLNGTLLPHIDSDTKFPVVVRVGNLRYSVGSVSLVSPPQGLPSGAVAGIALSVSVLFAILFLVLYKRGVLSRLPFSKRIFNRTEYIPTYSADPERLTRNDYQDFPGGSAVRRPEQGGGCTDDANVPRISEETMQLLTVDNILFARDYLTIEKEIGQGHFGRVYKGELQLPGKEDSREVAVKTLNNCRYQDSESMDSFLKEGLMMKDFHHHNVLTLIGVCFEDTGFPMVILPFMKHGDLRSYIQDENNEPTIKMLIEFGIQIAEGMKYLSELKFVHRDLAARNCMLDEDLTVKVADFGLSRDVYEQDYYSSDNKKSKLPVKWMPPESLEKGTYTAKSDVWSFGVVLWELMTRGVTPYPEVGNWEILNYIKTGRRMLQPSFCPDMLYRIMLRCWDEDHHKRPAFAELAIEIRLVIEKMQNKNRKVGVNVTYVNVPSADEASTSSAV